MLLLRMDRRTEAYQVFEFLRDFTEESSMYNELIEIYNEMGQILQDEREYARAKTCFKRML